MSQSVRYQGYLDSVYLGCQSEVVYDLTRSVEISHALVQEPEHCRGVLHKSGTELSFVFVDLY